MTNLYRTHQGNNEATALIGTFATEVEAKAVAFDLSFNNWDVSPLAIAAYNSASEKIARVERSNAHNIAARSYPLNWH